MPVLASGTVQASHWPGGSPPPVVQVSSEHPKGAHPRGSQRGSQIPLPELAPPLAGGLPGDAEPGADLGPGVPAAAQDAPDECPVIVILHLPPRPLWCQPSLDTGSPGVLRVAGSQARYKSWCADAGDRLSLEQVMAHTRRGDRALDDRSRSSSAGCRACVEPGGLKNAVEAGRHSSHTAAAPTSQAATNGTTAP